jgi:hypothetical protein
MHFVKSFPFPSPSPSLFILSLKVSSLLSFLFPFDAYPIILYFWNEFQKIPVIKDKLFAKLVGNDIEPIVVSSNFSYFSGFQDKKFWV